MTLQELIDELAAASDGAYEDSTLDKDGNPVYSWRRAHPFVPGLTGTRITFVKYNADTIAMSQQEVWVKNLGEVDESAYYNEGRVPGVVLEHRHEPPVLNATPEEIKENLEVILAEVMAGRKYSDIQIQSGKDSSIISVVFYSKEGEAVQEHYRVLKDDKGGFDAFRVKG
jgi:hypothetical protein